MTIMSWYQMGSLVLLLNAKTNWMNCRFTRHYVYKCWNKWRVPMEAPVADFSNLVIENLLCSVYSRDWNTLSQVRVQQHKFAHV